MDNLLIIIPAIKKKAIIPDQLVKKLNGITLIQRAINIAKEITDNILIVTDSEEISLIAKRNGVDFYRDSKLSIDSNNIIDTLLKLSDKRFNDILIYRANTPLVDSKVLKEAYKEFKKDKGNALISVKNLDKQLLKFENKSIKKVKNNYFKELKSFIILSRDGIKSFKPYFIEDEKAIEINSYQDWWICEKLLQRKRIVFNVIGNIKVGMGHIYRAISLAHEITDHEIIFVCNKDDELAVENIASKDYKIISSNNLKELIIDLKPDLIINDILNSDKEFIKELKKSCIKVVNFEDVGDGAVYADLVFNELYDKALDEFKEYFHIKWGYEYYFLRDEFETAKQNSFKKELKKILISFGGTDQHNLTLRVLKNIYKFFNKIEIEIVCGGGYLYKKELEEFLKGLNNLNINLTYKTGVISSKMENCDLAFTSNGRTVYELAHMHIPSIVISQHERENTHHFSKLENGFINLGIVRDEIDELLRKYFLKIKEDNEYRYLLYLNSLKFNFLKNKKRVLNMILGLLGE